MNTKKLWSGLSIAIAFTCLFCSSGTARADEVLQASQDTYITQHGGLGGANSTHEFDPTLFAIWANGGAPGFRTYPLVEFDFAAVPPGRVVVGDATLELFVVGSNFGFQATRAVSAHEVLVPWAASTATFNNFGGAPDVNFGSDVGPALDTQPVAYPAPGDRYISWTIPQAVVQGWIDNPASNHGILVFNQEAPNFLDLQFGSMEHSSTPRLTFALAGGCCTNGPGTQTECIIAGEADCVTDGGLFLGGGTDCANVECDALLVTMESMSAERTPNGVTINWTTAAETDTVGFRLIRVTGASAEKKLTVIADLIPAMGDNLTGASYAFLDNAKQSSVAIEYYLEDIDIYGKVTTHGPIAVEDGRPARTKPGNRSRARN